MNQNILIFGGKMAPDNQPNNYYTYDIPMADLKIEPKSILHELGYTGTDAPGEVRRIITEILTNAADYARIRGEFTIIPREAFSIERGCLQCYDLAFFPGEIISRQLHNAETVAFFLATAGPRIQTWSHELINEGSWLAGYLVDTLGTVIVESAVEYLCDKLIKKIIPEHWGVSNRFSPGYCEWPVEDQHKLFTLFPKNFCGITLSKSALMHPIKSVSGLVGMGPTVKKAEYKCNLCKREHCWGRRSNLKSTQLR